jgi:hypothetical protein
VTECQLTFAEADYEQLHAHLFPGDNDEHGAVVRAGLCVDGDHIRLLVRDVHCAREGIDYVPGHVGYRALHPKFIHKHITACRDERWVYLAVHNHHSDRSVDFSTIDRRSHDEGYPALLDIAEGMPVGALVLGHQSIEADLWLPNGERRRLGECRIVGSTIRRIYPSPCRQRTLSFPAAFDRQVRMFGQAGQACLGQATVAVIGLGGIGSIVAEYLARLGVGRILLVDPDHLEDSNLSRVVGSTLDDAKRAVKKTTVAARHMKEIRSDAPGVEVDRDVAERDVLWALRHCDYIFLAADSMRARLVFNALVHQYLIPGVQLGAKITKLENGTIDDVMSVVRQVRPGQGCLWCNQLIDPTQLAIEAKTDEERRAQAYGTEEPNPSVIALNGVSASHSVNEFLLDFLGMREARRPVEYRHFHFLREHAQRVIPRRDVHCTECGTQIGSRLARGDGRDLPNVG